MMPFANLVLAELLDAAPDATLFVNRDGRIELANAQAERLFGYQRAELTGQPIEILIPEAARAGHPARRARYVQDPRPRPIDAGLDLSALRRDGTIFPAEIALSAIHAGPDIVIMAAVRDVTAQREAMAEIQRSNENLEAFAYSVAHDLRTPLRSLAGFSAALTEEYADALGDTGRGYASRIEAAAEHMAALIEDILNLATAARAPITIQPVDLGALAAAITADLRRQDPTRRVRLTIAQPATALADPVLIRGVLQNLLDNAWKFTSRTPEADIEFGTTPSADPARTAFYVRDNGVGFDPAYKDKLFRPFQRLHTTTEFPGTGIGLATVRQIIRRHHGDTYADSTPGHGTTITFTLPASPLTACPVPHGASPGTQAPPQSHRRKS